MQYPAISASILSADFLHLKDEIQSVESAGVDAIHIDVMDGSYVPNITMGPNIVQAVKQCTSLPLDVHLMIQRPENHIEAFAKAGASWISIHPETTHHVHRTLNLIKSFGVKAGLVLNPGTPLACISELVTDIDFVLLMSVNPGFGGQSFIPSSLNKLRKLRALLEQEHATHIPIEMDGGVSVKNIRDLFDAGAAVFVTGSALFGSKPYEKTVSDMKKACKV